MLDSAAPIPLDYQLPAEAYYHLVRALRLTLPPPAGDSAEALLQRDHAAIARIAALAPGNSAEADFAAHFVAASEQWKDCLRLAQQPETTPEWAVKYRAQALAMMREAKGAMRLLLQMQAARRKLEADNVACDRAARAEHVAVALMAAALPHPHPAPLPAGEGDRTVAPPPSDQAPPLAEPASATEPPQKPSPCGRGWGEGGAPEPLDPPAALTEAEHYAVLYPERAALIRRLRGLPLDLSFGPPDDDIVQALIAGRSPAFAALDRTFAEGRAA